MEIKIDKMSLEQWDKLKHFAVNFKPNLLERLANGGRYGHYLHISADPIVELDRCTAESRVTGYQKISLSVSDSYQIPTSSFYEGSRGGPTFKEYDSEQMSRRNQVMKGLVDLLIELNLVRE